MALEMKTRCERCEAELPPGGRAFICSHECSFCENCAEHLMHICPSCDGELVRRPRRSSSAQTARQHEEM
ncbi:MAG: DUF1272 domain-containing protein [bacterium]